MLLDEQTTCEQFSIYRQMSPGRRLEIAEELYWAARQLKAAWLRVQHPHWTEAQIAREVTRIFANARS
jgi:hypothetical protein